MLQIYQRSEDTGKPFKPKFTCTVTMYAYLFWTFKLPKQYVLNLMNINKLTFTIKIKF